MPSETDVQLQMFEASVRSFGPEVAYRNFAQMIGDASAQKVRHAYERKVGLIRRLQGSPTLEGKRVEPWYSGPSDDDEFWPALRAHLLKKRWPLSTVESLDRESTNVMRQLPPVFGPVDVKGLVVGYVQSGKTANYSALIAKAADTGYRLIIVLAGIHNSLRRQTQLRLQAELIGSNERIKTMWHTLTLPQEDFRARGTNTDAFLSRYSNQKILLVVKKNAHVLRRLIKWLKAAQPRLLEECPALIIDDEADQAGLDTSTGGPDQRTAINGLILELKKTLKSAYVGYTATPFANVLVDPSGDDLYPADFIVALAKPPGYFGAELFFGREPLERETELPEPPDMFRKVERDEVQLVRPVGRNDVEDFVPRVANSLRTAIEYFLLAACARWARGHRLKHTSMLVHTAMNVAVHKKLKTCIQAEVDRIHSSLSDPATRDKLQQLWNSEHERVRPDGLAPVSFSELWPHLENVLERYSVVVDNSQSDSRLIYKDEDELTEVDKVIHIAVGGNTLSRGLTIEGLIVSYFVRSASAYDTLLQMGRWFGYRPGYEDLPRLWMTDELRQGFRDLATVEEEIRTDIRRYAENKLTPLHFAVRIRTHPTLAVTSRLKMQFAVNAQINYAGTTRQTTYFYHRDVDWLQSNWKEGAALLERIGGSGAAFVDAGSHRYATDVPVHSVLQFLRGYKFHQDHTELTTELLAGHIDRLVKRGEWSNWTVATVSLQDASLPRVGIGPLTVAPVNRSKLLDRGEGVDLGTITTQDNFDFDLQSQQEPASPDAHENKKRKQTIRPIGAQPLLLLVPIHKDSFSKRVETKANKGQTRLRERSDLEARDHILGVAIAFPDHQQHKDGHVVREGDYIHVELPPQPEYMDREDVLLEEDDG